MIKEFNEKGYLIIKNFYDKKIISNIKKDIFDLSFQLYKKHFPRTSKINYKSNYFDFYLLEAKKKKYFRNN